MEKIKAVITAVNGYVPDYILTNEELTRLVDTNDEWITSRTGVKERHIQKEPGKATSDMGVKVVEGLLQKSNTRPEEIDLVICGTVTADHIFPDTANIICDKVGIRNGFGFDINAACSGFLYALATGAKFVESGSYKKVIVLGVDKMSSIVDYTDRSTCIIFGDGGGGVLLEPTTEQVGIMDANLRSDGAGRHFLYMKAGGSMHPPSIETVTNKEHFIFQDGKPVFKAAVKGMIESIKEICLRNQLGLDDIKWVIPHQANIRIINAVAEGLGFPIEKVTINIQKYGNTTAATLPLCLWEWESKFNKGDNIILSAFGGGFTWGSILIKWGK